VGSVLAAAACSVRELASVVSLHPLRLQWVALVPAAPQWESLVLVSG
jgi:hypothetical protein